MIHPLAVDLNEVLLRIKKCLRDPPYNFVIHTVPNTDAMPRRKAYWDTLEADFHWHIEVIPRLTRLAGFEWGTGFYINPTSRKMRPNICGKWHSSHPGFQLRMAD
jgi:UDPglucose--hexose-1-phosphate uridylyltransferase